MGDVLIPHETRPKVMTALEPRAIKRAPGRRRTHGNIALWVRLSFGALLE